MGGNLRYVENGIEFEIMYQEKKMPALNKRFGASGGVTSNNLLWGIERLWF